MRNDVTAYRVRPQPASWYGTGLEHRGKTFQGGASPGDPWIIRIPDREIIAKMKRIRETDQYAVPAVIRFVLLGVTDLPDLRETVNPIIDSEILSPGDLVFLNENFSAHTSS